MPLPAFMQQALAQYYGQRDPLGAAGDFITAPEISQMFGEMIGLWLAVMWQSMGSPQRIVLAELGPGRGTLMADILRAGRMVPPFLAAARIWLVETSPALRAIQQEKLAGFPVQWVERVEDLPDEPLLLVANEFFDALPIQQIIREQGQWRQRCVTVDGDGAFIWTTGAVAACDHPDPDGTIRESCPQGQQVVARLGRQVAKWGGALLLVDYGYDQSVPGDSLQAVKNHAFHPVLLDPGAADLTAHVDFYALAAAAIPGRAFGPVAQGAFLKNLGIETRLQALLANATPAQAAQLQAGVARLIDPAAMGTLFKVMAVTHPAYGPPPGFAG